MTYVDNRINKIARRMAVRENVERKMQSAGATADQTRTPTSDDARRLLLMMEAVGDLTSALNRGQSIDQELLTLQAFAQLWSEKLVHEKTL